MRTFLMLTTLAVASMSLTGSLAAQDIASPAPELAWTSTFNFGDIPSANLGELRDSVVLLEFISTQQKVGSEQLHRLDALHTELAERGLVVITVTSEKADDVKQWVEKNAVKRPVAVGFNRHYDLNGVPDSYLIDKDGKILWHGHPTALDRALLDNALVGAAPAIVVAGLEEVGSLRRSKDYGATYRKAQQMLTDGGLSERAMTQAKRWCKQYETFVTTATAAAAKADTEKDLYEVWLQLSPVASYYQGVPGADRAKARVDELLADAKSVREIEAGKDIAAAKARETELDYDGAYELYKAAARKHANTRPGKAAAAAMKELEKNGMLGFDARCPYCKAAGKACPQHDVRTRKRHK